MAATLLTKSCTKVVALFQVSLGFLVLACLVAPLFAQDTFTAASGLWSQPNNWSLNRLPTSSDDCLLPANSAVSEDTGGSCANFTLDSKGSLTVTPGYLFLYSTSFTNQGTINVGSGNGIGIFSGRSLTEPSPIL